MDAGLLTGWRKGPTIKDEESYLNDEREMMILTTNTSSRLAKENEVYLTFEGKEHFSDALKRSDEIWAKHYASTH